MESTSDDSDISDIWDCDESPLAYMVELRITFRYVDKNYKPTLEILKKNFETIL